MTSEILLPHCWHKYAIILQWSQHYNLLMEKHFLTSQLTQILRPTRADIILANKNQDVYFDIRVFHPKTSIAMLPNLFQLSFTLMNKQRKENMDNAFKTLNTWYLYTPCFLHLWCNRERSNHFIQKKRWSTLWEAKQAAVFSFAILHSAVVSARKVF